MNIWRPMLGGALLTLLLACGANPGGNLAQRPGGDESGIGGTGMLAEESGIGGTGIVGEITGFGSVFVNGAEVELTVETRLTVDGEPVARHALAVGEVVALRAVTRDGRLVADEAHLRHAVIGPVQAVEAGERRVEVLGQTVRVARGPLPAVGERVAVSGFRDAGGVIHATRIAPAGRAGSLVVGVPQRRGDGWRLGALRLALPAAPPPGEVRLRGRWQGSIFTVDRMQPVALLPFHRPVTRILVQGFVRPIGAGRLAIDGLTFAPAGGAPLSNARPVRLELQRAGEHWRLLRTLRPETLPRGRPRPPRQPMPGGHAWPGGRPPAPGRGGMGGGMFRP